MGKNVFIYLLGNSISKLLPFLILPLLVRFLTPAEFGFITIFQFLIILLTPVLGLNMHNAINKYFFNQSQEEVGKKFFNIIIILALSTSLCLILILIYFVFFDNLLGLPRFWSFIIPVVVFFQSIKLFNLIILRNLEKAFSFIIYQIFNVIIDMGTLVVLLVVFNMGWEARAWGIFIASIIVGSISLVNMHRLNYLKYGFEGKTLKTIFMLSAPLVIYFFGEMILTMSDRFFIDRLLGKEALGIYAVGFYFGLIIIVITEAVNHDWSRWLYKQLAEITEEKKLRIVKYTYLLKFAFIALAVIFSLISYLLIPVMTTEPYYGAMEVVMLISLAYAVNGFYNLLLPYFITTGKTRELTLITFLAGIIGIIANCVLIKLNGIVGAAQALLISFSLLYAGIWWKASRIYSMPWGLKNFILPPEIRSQQAEVQDYQTKKS